MGALSMSLGISAGECRRAGGAMRCSGDAAFWVAGLGASRAEEGESASSFLPLRNRCQNDGLFEGLLFGGDASGGVAEAAGAAVHRAAWGGGRAAASTACAVTDEER